MSMILKWPPYDSVSVPNVQYARVHLLPVRVHMCAYLHVETKGHW